jgi:predicted HTH domain antitoxin
MKRVIEIPDAYWDKLEPYKDRLLELLLLGLSQARLQEALLLYQRGAASVGRAAELAGLKREEFIRYARIMGVQPRWDAQMVEEELQ